MLKDLRTASACLFRCWQDADDPELRAVLRQAQEVISKAIGVFIKRARVESEVAS